MDVGAMLFATDRSIGLDVLAPALEERGYESLLVPERTHTPSSRTRIWNGGPPLTPAHLRTLDPFVALTLAAAVTSRLRLITAVCLVTERDPIGLAKAAASLDVVSGGRFELGVGYGWHPGELANHGVAAPSRADVGRERIAAIRSLWTDETASYDGEHVRLSPSTMWPKPVQDRLPILLGIGPSGFDDVVDLADGWMPYAGFHGELVENIAKIRQRAHERGRDPGSVSFTVLGVRPEPARLDELEAAGVRRVVVDIPSQPEADALRALDRITAVLDSSGRLGAK